MNRLLTLAFSAVLFMGLLALVAGQLSAPSDRPAARDAPKSRQAAMFAEDTVPAEGTVIRRDATGQFRLYGKINGADEKFLIDTGADVLALTLDSAEAAGIHADPATFEPILQTASGEGRGARYVIQDMEIAGHQLHDVDAVVVDGLSTNLLGQSVLKRLGRVELRGDSMVIGGE